MKTRLNRRSFLRQSASLLATSIRPASVSMARGASDGSVGEWQYYGRDPGRTHYSPLDQIDRSNVHNLRVAWTYHTGDKMDRPQTTIECTPVVVDGVMYITTAQLKVCALDAANGRLLWRFDPFEGAELDKLRGVNRGVDYWQKGQKKRIFFTADSRLICLDASSGKPMPEFGDKGTVDLTKGLDRDISRLYYTITSPGMVYKDLLILGSTEDEGPEPAAPGHIRAFDVFTGNRTWIFHTIPFPGELGHDTWSGDSWKMVGGANAWGGITLDEKRGWIFLGLGSATFDYYGGQRVGQNLFANCVLALEAATGKRIWHYQVVHHDLWDRDLPCPPSLVTVNHDGRRIDAVVQTTKFGRVFLLDRETGKPLFPVEERPVPPSDMPGDRAWPTQPFPVKPPPYSRQVFTEDDLTNISPEAHAYVQEIFKKARGGKPWLPINEQPTIVFPGLDGGTNWGGGSVDPATGWLYVNSENEPWILSLKAAKAGAGYPFTFGEFKRFEDQEGYPAIKPPWGQLTAIDLNKGEFVWQVPLGELKELKARTVPQTGTRNIGGSVVTAGGLLFIGATKDEKFRAFDKATGKVLWEAQLPAGGYASPCTYEVDGKQYVVIAAGGGGKPRTKSGDAFVAFALP